MKEMITENTETILFESKGMPSKMRNILLILGIFLTAIAVVSLIRVMTLPRHTAFNSGLHSETEMIDGKVVTSFTRTAGITDEERKQSVTILIVILVSGLIDISGVIAGRRFFFRIYETHIEGCSGFWFLSKKIHLPIQKIGELSSNTRGLMPSIMIRTMTGNCVSIFMNPDKVTEAEKMLRYKMEYEKEERKG